MAAATTHLFTVPSTVTRLVAFGAIEHLSLDPSEVVFVLRSLHDQSELEGTGIRTLSSPFLTGPEFLPSHWNPRVCQRHWDRFDRVVREVVGDRPFHLYTPHTHKRPLQALILHPGCDGFSLLEGGTEAYLSASQVDALVPVTRISLRDRLGYGRRLRDAAFYSPGCTNAFAVSDEAFEREPNRIVLKDVFARCAETNPDCHTVLAMRPVMVYGKNWQDANFEALRQTFTWLRSDGVDRIHFKSHPAEAVGSAAEFVEDRLRDVAGPIELTKLPTSASLEGMAHANPKLRFIVSNSSIGLYASMLGCPVLSYAKIMASLEPSFASYLEVMPDALMRRLRFLEPAA